MRQFDETEKRWSQFFKDSFGADLRQAVLEGGVSDPCERGLRSVCWKSFLLNGPLSPKSWTKKLSESRSAYSSLRDHFLKFINNPNDLHSSVDPLADDATSPWATLRQDEINREEIWQDVIRCNVENYFFREPSTQRKLLDILFIYSKLNPDTGYRQGMHELLAPVLWVVDQDSVEFQTIPASFKSKDGADFMLDVLDSRYVEHDAFSLFCAIMQTTKAFYEVGESRDSSAIIAQSERIHKDLLGAIDPDLALHLETVGIVPQIFAIRWLRLLFGREFDFKDTLILWDVLLAEGLNVEIVDMTCVAILLRMRWQLLDADYTTAITLLTKLNLPKQGDNPRNLVKDAVNLYQNRNPIAGATVIERRTGQRPANVQTAVETPIRSSTPVRGAHRKIRSQDHASPARSPARFATPQKQLENLFGNVSANLQKQTEGWSVQNVSKSLRGAIGEVRRNVETLQGSHSRGGSLDIARPSAEDKITESETKLKNLEARNQALSKMLDGCLESLRTWKMTDQNQALKNEDVFNTALAKIQFVSVYLADAEIPVPNETKEEHPLVAPALLVQPSSQDEKRSTGVPLSKPGPPSQLEDGIQNAKNSEEIKTEKSSLDQADSTKESSSAQVQETLKARPSLSSSSWSFMLGEDRRGTSFVKSKPLPEERRGSNSKGRPESLWNSPDRPQEKKDKDLPKKSVRNEDDGFTMSSLHGN